MLTAMVVWFTNTPMSSVGSAAHSWSSALPPLSKANVQLHGQSHAGGIDFSQAGSFFASRQEDQIHPNDSVSMIGCDDDVEQPSVVEKSFVGNKRGMKRTTPSANPG